MGIFGSTPAKTKGRTSTRQRWPASSPEKLPGLKVSRSGSAVAIMRAVSTSMRCVSSERAPRTVVAIREPMAASATAMTASATSTSISMKPAVLRFLDRRRCGNFRSAALELVDRGNLDSSREPVDADLVSGAEPRQRDHAAARHAAGEEPDRRTGGALVAAGGEHRIEADVVREAHGAAGRAGFDRPGRGIDLRRYRRAAPQRRVAVGLEQGGCLDGVGFQPRARGTARKRRQENGGEDRQDGDDAHDLEKGEAVLPETGAPPLPKFVVHRSILGHELRKQRGTSKSMIRVPLFDLKCLYDLRQVV